jgi:hypothetical protein
VEASSATAVLPLHNQSLQWSGDPTANRDVL